MELYPMDQRRADLRMVALDGSLYVVGGWWPNGAHGANERFTPNSWSYIANSIYGREMVVTCLAADEENKVFYQLGGYSPKYARL